MPLLPLFGVAIGEGLMERAGMEIITCILVAGIGSLVGNWVVDGLLGLLFLLCDRLPLKFDFLLLVVR